VTGCSAANADYLVLLTGDGRDRGRRTVKADHPACSNSRQSLGRGFSGSLLLEQRQFIHLLLGLPPIWPENRLAAMGSGKAAACLLRLLFYFRTG